MADNSPSRTADKIVIRVPDGLRDRIAAKAKENGRSVNSELVDLLERVYPELTPTPELVQRARRILDRIEKKPGAELEDGVRFNLVGLINNAMEYGAYKGDYGLADMMREVERDEAQSIATHDRKPSKRRLNLDDPEG